MKNNIGNFFKIWGISNSLFALIFCVFSLYKGEIELVYWNLNALVTLIISIILYTIGIVLSCSHDWKRYKDEVFTGNLEGHIVYVVFCSKCFKLRGFGAIFEVDFKNTSPAAEHEFRLFLLKNKGKKQIQKLKKLLKGEV